MSSVQLIAVVNALNAMSVLFNVCEFFIRLSDVIIATVLSLRLLYQAYSRFVFLIYSMKKGAVP